ncbi:methyltransferase domain-containing protein [bacterium]|nr:methyltransferase domain-containing protein [bacterium]
MRTHIFGKNPVTWFRESVQRFGWTQTLTIIWSVVVDTSFDRRFGTDTTRRIPVEKIKTTSSNIVHSMKYGASKAMPFRKLMAELKLPTDGVFVDLGSGKGRAVMLAAEYGFRKVIGLEFSGELCRTAEDNLRKFLRKRPTESHVEIIETDVTQYRLSDEETVFFLFDPFHAPILKQVMQNILESAERRPRDLWLIYHAPREQQVIEESGLFTDSKLHVVLGAEFMVYSIKVDEVPQTK